MIGPFTYVLFVLAILYICASMLSVASFCRYLGDRQVQRESTKSIDSGVDCYASVETV